MQSLSLSDYLSEKGIGKWIDELSATDAPIVKRNLACILSYFSLQMPSLSITDALSFIRCMDLSKPVRTLMLAPGTRLLAFRLPTEDPFKLFYTARGSDLHSSGVNPANRIATSFTVRSLCSVLESYTAGAIDTWTRRGADQPLSLSPTNVTERSGLRGWGVGYMSMGGGIQYIIPNAHSVLQLEL